MEKGTPLSGQDFTAANHPPGGTWVGLSILKGMRSGAEALRKIKPKWAAEVGENLLVRTAGETHARHGKAVLKGGKRLAR